MHLYIFRCFQQTLQSFVSGGLYPEGENYVVAEDLGRGEGSGQHKKVQRDNERLRTKKDKCKSGEVEKLGAAREKSLPVNALGTESRIRQDNTVEASNRKLKAAELGISGENGGADEKQETTKEQVLKAEMAMPNGYGGAVDQ